MIDGADESVLAERTLNSSRRFAGRVISLRVDEVELPSGLRSEREVVEHPGGIAIVAIDPGRRVVLVRQYRYAVAHALWEIPAGKLGPGEDPRDCALRELEEETGYRVGRLHAVTSFYTSPGFCDEMLHLFVATDLSPGDARPDEDEIVQVALVARDRLDDMLARGEIRDGKTLLGLYYAISTGLI